jgi:hypothetical protein
VPDSVALACVYLFSLGLHLVSMDHGLEEHFKGRERFTAAVLVLTIVAAAATSRVYHGAEVEVDVATALLAGFMMYQVFREELPEPGTARLRWFVAGAAFMLISTMLVD